MTIDVRTVTRCCGTRILGVDLAAPLDGATFSQALWPGLLAPLPRRVRGMRSRPPMR